MSAPHLDTRIIGGKRSLLFGPYAGFSTRFLKHGRFGGPVRFAHPQQHRAAAPDRARAIPAAYAVSQINAEFMIGCFLARHLASSVKQI
jgi:hypothetical protein